MEFMVFLHNTTLLAYVFMEGDMDMCVWVGRG